MFWRTFTVECLKHRHTALLLPALLLPAALVALQFANFSLRYARVTRSGLDPWTLFVNQHVGIWSLLLLPMLAALLTASLGAAEHRNQQWRAQLALPQARAHLYLSKALLACAVLALSTALLAAGMLLSARLLGRFPVGPALPLLTSLFGPWVGAFGVVQILMWISVRSPNLAAPLALSAVCSALAIFLAQSAWMRWVPWVYPLYSVPALNPPGTVAAAMAAGLGVGVAVLALALRDFERRDIL